jgi:hypothetical protein
MTIGMSVSNNGKRRQIALRIMGSPKSIDCLLIPNTIIRISGIDVMKAIFGVGLSIINGRIPTTRGRVISQSIFSGISEILTMDTLGLAEMPINFIVIKILKTETVPEITNSIRALNVSDKNFDDLFSFTAFAIVITEK